MKTEAHKKITEFTIHQFLDNMDGPFRTMLHPEKARIIDSTEAEDVWYRNPQRPFHWHFFHPQGVDIPDHFNVIFRFTLFSKEALRRHIAALNDNFSKLKALLRQTDEDKERFYRKHKGLSRAIGGVLHHVQDMSTPSHVVPVFHGSPAPGDFEPAVDTFEDFADANISQQIMGRSSWFVGEADILDSSPAQSYEQLYESSAVETLEFLKKTTVKATIDGSDTVSMNSSIFWKPYDFENDPQNGNETAGFGSYGPMEPFFNEKGGEGTIDGRRVKIEFEGFSHIYFQCLNEMIRNSYRCLKLISKEYCKALD